MPRALKRVLVPIWNAGHRLKWAVEEYGGAVLFGRFGRCECCGRWGARLYRPRAIPARLRELWGLPPRVARAVARKETLDCSRCGAKLRARRLARVVIELFPGSGGVAGSLKEWSERSDAKGLRVAEINRIEGFHESISGLPGLDFSDFQDGVEPGGIKNGVRSENLLDLSYDDEIFDLVLTSETLEHVPDLRIGLSEIQRVLKKGGLHIFTVPLLPGVEKTFPRAKLRDDGTVEPLAVSISHPGGDWGYPVFTEFGSDFPGILREAGFATEIRFGPTSEDDVAQVFVCRKV